MKSNCDPVKIKRATFRISVLFLVANILAITVKAQTSFLSTYSFASLPLPSSQFKPIQCSDGSFLLIGYALSDSVFTSTIMVAAKIDSIGNLQWSKTFSGPEEFRLMCSLEVPGGFLLAGGKQISASDPHDLVLIRIDQNGDTLWTRQYDNCGGLYSLHFVPGGDIVGTGYSAPVGNPHPQVICMDTAGDILWRKEFLHTPFNGYGLRNGSVCSDGSIVFYFQGTLVTKLDSAGNYLWSLPRYNFPSTMLTSSDIIELADGSFFLMGSLSRIGQLSEAFICKITSTGQLLWTKSYGLLSSSFNFSSASLNPDNSINMYSGTLDTLTNKHVPALLKLDTAGNVLWAKKYPGYQSNYFVSGKVNTCVNGGYVISGTVYDSSIQASEIFLIRNNFDSSLCHQEDVIPTITLLADSGFINTTVSTTSTSYTEVYTSIDVGSNVLVPGYRCSLTYISGIPALDADITVYPNPANTVVHILSEELIVAVEVYNELGVLTESLEGSGMKLSLELVPGIYFLKVYLNERFISKLVIVH